MKSGKGKIFGAVIGAAAVFAIGIAVFSANSIFASSITEVSNKADLIKALNDPAIEVITLTDDITVGSSEGLLTATRKASKNTADDKTGVTIDGWDGNAQHKLTVSKSAGLGGASSLTFDGIFTDITVRNLTVEGQAFEGFFRSVKNVNFTFDNVTSDSPAFVKIDRKDADVVINNSTINLTKASSYSSEAVDMYNGTITLQGTVIINKANSNDDPAKKTNDYDEVFYFRGNETKLIVDEDAVVTIVNDSKPNKGSYYSGLMFLTHENNQHTFEIKKRAAFTFTTAGGVIVEEWPLRSFTIEEGAYVEMTVNTLPESISLTSGDMGVYFRARDINIGEGAKWYLTANGEHVNGREAVLGVNNLTVGENAELLVKSDDTNAWGLVRMCGDEPTITLNNPAKVEFDHSNAFKVLDKYTSKEPAASTLFGTFTGGHSAYGWAAGGAGYGTDGDTNKKGITLTYPGTLDGAAVTFAVTIDKFGDIPKNGVKVYDQAGALIKEADDLNGLTSFINAPVIDFTDYFVSNGGGGTPTEPTEVSNQAELRKALRNPSISEIILTKRIQITQNIAPDQVHGSKIIYVTTDTSAPHHFEIINDVSIDFGTCGTVVLDGQGGLGGVTVDNQREYTLKNVTIQNVVTPNNVIVSRTPANKTTLLENVVVRNCVVTESQSDGNSGDIVLDLGYGTLTINNCSITDSSVNGEKSFVVFSYSTMNLTNSTISNNTVTRADAPYFLYANGSTAGWYTNATQATNFFDGNTYGPTSTGTGYVVPGQSCNVDHSTLEGLEEIIL